MAGEQAEDEDVSENESARSRQNIHTSPHTGFLTADFNQSLQGVTRPASLQTFAFGHDFDQSLQGVKHHAIVFQTFHTGDIRRRPKPPPPPLPTEAGSQPRQQTHTLLWNIVTSGTCYSYGLVAKRSKRRRSRP